MKTLKKDEMRAFIAVLLANQAAVKTYAKFARIQAVKAAEEEEVKTVLANGRQETTNTAQAGDWIVTNPGGEKYVISGTKFPKKYEAAPELGEGWFKPTGGVQKFVELDSDTTFVCSWGEEQFIARGGMINVSDLNDIYGIARDEFFATYKECDADGNFLP